MLNNKQLAQLVKSALDASIIKLEENMAYTGDKFITVTSTNNRYGLRENDSCWTQSFYTGMLWLAHEITGEDKFSRMASNHTMSFKERLDGNVKVDTHDLGFMYTLSCVADYRLTGSEVAKATALDAADHLMLRYKEKGEFIQAWGDINDPSFYRMIIDCYMNLPLLFWAHEVTGKDKYRDVAVKHLNTGRKYLVREDDSSYHTFYFDPETGEPVQGVTHQGYADDSCWSRGQAWGIYGLALAYKYTKDESIINDFVRLTEYYIDHQPEDLVAYWDLYFVAGDEERDSSAAAIVACGLLEMMPYLKDKALVKKYNDFNNGMMESLIKNYTTFESPTANGLLFQGVYSKPGNKGVNEMTIWGDYYFLEALVRMSADWNPYW